MKNLFILLCLLLFSVQIFSQDTQFRGPMRDGHYPDKGLLQKWPEGGPRLLMSAEGIGLGWSQPILYKGIVYVTGMKDTLDVLSAIDMSGKILWQKPYGRAWDKSYPDTRVTPTIEDDRIYLLSGTGRLVCFNTMDGNEIWSFEVDKTYESKWHRWGVAESPLIVDDKVIVTPGGDKASAVAFDKKTGKIIWEGKPNGDVRSYVAAVIYKYKDYRYILAMTYNNILALDPASGNTLWSFPHNKQKPGGGSAITINSPIYKNDEIYISNGYDYPSIMLKIASDHKSASLKWTDTTLDNHHHGLINAGDFIYGSNWLSNTKGQWVCLRWDDGKVQYVKDWHSKGSLVYADNMLYAIDEREGNVALVKPDPAGFEVVSTFALKKGKGEFWAHPSIYDKKLFLRYNNNLFAYDIAAK